MDIKQEICKAFCGALSVSEVPIGLAVGTGYAGMSGDAIGFYIVGPNSGGKYTIEDDGLLIPAIEAEGAEITNNKTRLEAFTSLLDDYSVQFDDDSGELKTGPISLSEVPSAALRFTAFLLRVQDLVLMSVERAASTFKEDATRLIMELASDRVKIEHDFVIHEKLKEIPADLGIISKDHPPVALFFGVSDAKVLEALLLQSYATNEKIPCSVVALLETESAVSKKTRQRAHNHLDTVPYFRQDERAACIRVLKEAGLAVQ